LLPAAAQSNLTPSPQSRIGSLAKTEEPPSLKGFGSQFFQCSFFAPQSKEFTLSI
jgi:hypothetical protein